VSISSIFYGQILLKHIPKAQKDSHVVSIFLHLGSSKAKAADKMFVKVTSSPTFQEQLIA